MFWVSWKCNSNNWVKILTPKSKYYLWAILLNHESKTILKILSKNIFWVILTKAWVIWLKPMYHLLKHKDKYDFWLKLLIYLSNLNHITQKLSNVNKITYSWLSNTWVYWIRFTHDMSNHKSLTVILMFWVSWKCNSNNWVKTLTPKSKYYLWAILLNHE